MATFIPGGDVLAEATRVWRAQACLDFGCADAAFDSHALTIVSRPTESRQKHIVTAVTLGTGTVLSVEESWLDFVRTLEFEKHFRAFRVQLLLLPMIEEARRRGVEVTAHNPGLGFLPAQLPITPLIPNGLELQRWPKEMCVDWAPTFHNALWDDPGDVDDFLYALVLLSGPRPVAMAGAWKEGEGLIEIGVDVAREERGRGLAPMIVRTMARHILDSDKIPTYYCAATNVRSHRTALASGFVPVVSMGGIRPRPQKAALQPE